MTSLIISPLRLRKIQLAIIGTVSSMIAITTLSIIFEINPILINFNIRNQEDFTYLQNFPIPLLAEWLTYTYDFLLSDWG